MGGVIGGATEGRAERPVGSEDWQKFSKQRNRREGIRTAKRKFSRKAVRWARRWLRA